MVSIFRRILKGRSERGKAYDDVIVDICSACGAGCIYCLHQRKRLVKPSFMKSEILYRIGAIAAKEGFKLIHLYMSGEPMLHPELPEFIAYLNGLDLNLRIASKFWMSIDFGKLDAALERCRPNAKVTFVITIDSLDSEIQKRIANIDTDVVKRNLQRIAELQKRYEYVNTDCTTVVNRLNENQLGAIREYLHSLGMSCYYPKSMGYYMPYMASQEDIAQIADLLPLDNTYRDRFSIEDGILISRMTTCNMLIPAVSPHGDLTLCCHDMLYRMNLGNVVLESSIKKIMSSLKYRKAANEGKLMRLPICRGCN